jgi:hypothetical protein
LSNNRNAALGTRNDSSELNVHLMRRGLNVQCDQRNSSLVANESQHHSDRRHNHSSDEWRRRDRRHNRNRDVWKFRDRSHMHNHSRVLRHHRVRSHNSRNNNRNKSAQADRLRKVVAAVRAKARNHNLTADFRGWMQISVHPRHPRFNLPSKLQTL